MASLEFKDICYSVPAGVGKPKQFKTILKGVTGTINSGEMVAIIGSSGAGKTTLLNILAGRTKTGRLSGEILFNGAKRVHRKFKRDAAYVEQDDLLYPDLTVRETLEYAASFRLNNSKYSAVEKKARVDDLLRSLRLIKAENTFIGNASIQGVSGGERKRVSIGVEIITDPKLVMLDEPTSGLDSNSSEKVIQLVKDIAFQRNIISVASIHQPSFETFSLFDKLILLAPGGVVYFGPALKALGYFESIGYKCPPSKNPSDFFIDTMTIKTENEHEFEQSTQRVESLKQTWSEYTQSHGHVYREESWSARTDFVLGRGQLEKGSTPNTIAEAVHAGSTAVWGNSWTVEFFHLLRRSWQRQMRSKSVVMSYVLNSAFTMLLIGFIFFRKTQGYIEAQNKIGLMYLLCITVVFPVVMPILPTMISEKTVTARERSSGSYRVSSYFASVYFTKVPISLASNAVLLTGIYLLAKFQYNAAKYFIFMAVYFSGLLCSLGFAFVISSAVNSAETAMIISPMILLAYIIFGGNLVNGDSVTPVLSWIQYISYPHYTYMAAMQNEMGNRVFDCAPGANDACYPNGQAVIDSLGLNKLTIFECIMVNLGMSAGYVIIAYLFLRFKSKPRFVWL